MARGPRLRRKRRKHLFGPLPHELLRGPPDFRDKATRIADSKLSGTWWRCGSHGLTQDAIVLGGLPYCPDTFCRQVCIVAHEVPLYDAAAASFGWQAGPNDAVRLEDNAQSACDLCEVELDVGHVFLIQSRRVGERHVCLICARSSSCRALRAAARAALGED